MFLYCENMTGPPRQYFFCINSGRSGSKYLTTLFAASPQAVAFHEAMPQMNGDLLHLIEREPYDATYDARRFKADAVRTHLARHPERHAYAETNHMFIKTFFDVVMREFDPVTGERVGIVILRRDLTAVVKSFAELGMFTNSNAVWPAWMVSPYARTRAIEPAAPAGTLDPLETTVAYLVDIEARAQRFLRDYPHADVFETRLEAFADPAEIARLYAWAGLTLNDAARALSGQPVNERHKRKAQIGATVRREACEAAVARYLQRCADAGITVPPTLALTP